MSLTVRRGDTHPLYWQILDRGTPADLTGATARLIVKMVSPSVGTAIILTATIDGDKVKHILTGTLAIGTYQYEIEITKSGAISTAPTKGFGTLVVLPDLA